MTTENTIFDPARHWGWLLTAGIFTSLLGAVAIARPVASTAEVEFLIGLVLIASGLANVVLSIVMRAQDGFWTRLALGLGSVGIGVLIFRAPLTGLMSMTLVLAAYFGFEGIMRIIEAVQSRKQKGWVMTLIGGIAATVLSILIFNGWPVDSLWAIGLLVGVNLIIGGSVMIGLAVTAANAEDQARDRLDALGARMAA